MSFIACQQMRRGGNPKRKDIGEYLSLNLALNPVWEGKKEQEEHKRATAKQQEMFPTKPNIVLPSSWPHSR